MSEVIGKVCVVRSSPSGVWLGEVVSVDGQTVTLRNARRAWYWKGAASCSGLAVNGPSPESKMPAAVSTAVINECCELLVATPEAIAKWNAVPVWTA